MTSHGVPQSLTEIVRHRKEHLTRYQDARLAARYEALVERVRTAEDAAVPGSTALAPDRGWRLCEASCV